MANYLVTGSAGFLGTNLCKRLLEEGNSVVGVDNFNTGQKANLGVLEKYPKFQFHEADINDGFNFLENESIDGVYNLACPASPPAYQKDPVFTWKTSVIGVMNCLSLAKEKNAKFFHTSTSEVYGNPLEHPQKETYWGNVNPIGIRSCYDEGKRAAETLIMDSHRMNGQTVKIVRIFNTYGPYMDPYDGRVVSNFILQALQDQDITIYGDGTQTRSFCYVDDLIEGFIRLMDTEDSYVGPVNLGNPGEFTMLELADKVLSKINSKSEKVFKELPKDDPVKRKPDISVAQSKLDWTPKISLEQGLDKTIEYYSELLKNRGI
jgi:UDP-glucuronate decarboxylase